MPSWPTVRQAPMMLGALPLASTAFSVVLCGGFLPLPSPLLPVRYRYGAWTQNFSHDSPHACATPDAPGVATRDDHRGGAGPAGPGAPPRRRGAGEPRHWRPPPGAPAAWFCNGGTVSGTGA